MRIKKYLSPSGALNKRYTDKDFEGTGWHYIPRSDIKPDDKLLNTALKLGEEYYLAGEDGYLLPSNTVNDFLKNKGLTTAYDYYYDQLNLSPFTKNLNNYFTLQYDANDRIGQLMRLRAADRKANQLTPGAGTFVVAPVATTLAGIGGATLAPWLTSALATPTGQALMYGTFGGELLNGASQLGGYDNFGHLIYNAGGGENWRNLPEWQKTLWNFTNPGYLISGPTSKAVDLTVEGLQQAATNTVKNSIVSDATKTAVNDYARNMLGIDPSLLTYTIKSETAPYILPYYMNRALNTNMPKSKGYEEYKIPGIVIDLINENLAGTTYRTQKDIDKVNQILKNIKYRLWDSERGYADNVDKHSYGVFDNSPLFGRYGRILISGGLLGRDHRRVLRHEVDHLVDLTITGTSKEYRKMLKEAFPEVQEIERNQLKGDIRDVILQEHNLNNASDEARRDFILSRRLLSDEELVEYITTVGYGNEIPRSALTPHRLTQIRRLLAGYNVYPSVKLPPKSNIINGVKTEMREIPTFTGNSFIKRLTKPAQNDTSYWKDSFGEEILEEPYPGSDMEILSALGKGMKYGIDYRKSPEHLKQILETMGWDDLAMLEYIQEQKDLTGRISAEVSGFDEGMVTKGKHRSGLNENGKVIHLIFVNRDRMPTSERVIEAGVHEMGGHGMTGGISPENLHGLYLQLAERFPRTLELMLKNEQLKNQTLVYNDTMKEILTKELYKKVEEWRKQGLTDEEIESKAILWGKLKNKKIPYISDTNEITTRAITENVIRNLGLTNSSSGKFNSLGMQEASDVFTPESLEKFIKVALSNIGITYGLSKLNQPTSNRKGGKLIPRKYK